METENNKRHFLNNGDRKQFCMRKKRKSTQLLTCTKHQEKSMFLKIAAQAFETEDFCNIFLKVQSCKLYNDK